MEGSAVVVFSALYIRACLVCPGGELPQLIHATIFPDTVFLLALRRDQALPYPVCRLQLCHIAGGDCQHEVDGIALAEH